VTDAIYISIPHGDPGSNRLSQVFLLVMWAWFLWTALAGR